MTLLGWEELVGVGPTDFELVGVSEPFVPGRRFDESGAVVVPDAPPGEHMLFVNYPDLSWARMELNLVSGEDWDFEFQVAGASSLDVRVLDPEGRPLKMELFVIVAANEEAGILALRGRVVNLEGRVQFTGLRAPRAQVVVFNNQNQENLATREVTFDSDHEEIEIRLGQEQLRVHVVGADGSPVVGAHVGIRSSDGTEVLGADASDVSGFSRINAVREPPLVMDVKHGLLGTRLGIPTAISKGEIEVVLRAVGHIEAVIQDGEIPLEGVSVRFETPSAIGLGDAQDSDASGLVRFEALGEGRYLLACRRGDCWPASIERELAPDEEARVSIQMRRLASARIEVRDKEGQPVAGLSLDIVSKEFGTPVESWLREGRVQSTTGSKTGADGRVWLQGLPNGPYTWATRHGDEPDEGSFVLTPGDPNEVVILLR
jgi:hypothetical protein